MLLYIVGINIGVIIVVGVKVSFVKNWMIIVCVVVIGGRFIDYFIGLIIGLIVVNWGILLMFCLGCFYLGFVVFWVNGGRGRGIG